MKNRDASALLKEICEVHRKRSRFYSEKEQMFLNMVKEPITNGKDIGPNTGKELERLYRKSQGG